MGSNNKKMEELKQQEYRGAFTIGMLIGSNNTKMEGL